MASHREYNSVMGNLLLPENADTRAMLRDPMVLQAIQLADRLREAKGEALEAEEYEAISEATGVSKEYLKFIEQSTTSRTRANFLDSVRVQYMALENDTRRMVASGVLATVTALLWRMGDWMDMITERTMGGAQYGIFQTICYILGAAALYNSAISRSSKSAVLSGVVYGGSAYLLSSVFALLFQIQVQLSPPFILLAAAICGGIGLLSHALMSKTRSKGVLKDRGTVRQELLKQLVDLQEQLTEGQQAMTFLSLDVVGSTKMKMGADPLSVEFTFNEYHKYVEMVSEKHFGRVHSTAGDGVTVAFDHPQNAFNAAKQIQTGLVELNVLRNKIGIPIVLRAGIHSGEVVTPEAGNVTSVNFASVIDIAAHIQKEAPPGAIAVTDAAANSIVGGPTSIGTERVCVHENHATIWQRRRSLDSFTLSVPKPAEA